MYACKTVAVITDLEGCDLWLWFVSLVESKNGHFCNIRNDPLVGLALFLKLCYQVVEVGPLLNQVVNLFSNFSVLSQRRIEVSHYAIKPDTKEFTPLIHVFKGPCTKDVGRPPILSLFWCQPKRFEIVKFGVLSDVTYLFSRRTILCPSSFLSRSDDFPPCLFPAAGLSEVLWLVIFRCWAIWRSKRWISTSSSRVTLWKKCAHRKQSNYNFAIHFQVLLCNRS